MAFSRHVRSFVCLVLWPALVLAQPARFEHGAVVSQDRLASEVGAAVLRDGGNAIDAAVATAFALAVTHPPAGNIGGGGFLVYAPDGDEPEAFDFRETAPAAAHPEMWLVDGEYDARRHHNSHLAVGVPGTVAGLHLAWREHGTRPWPDLVAPAIALAEDGFVVSEALASSLRRALRRMRAYPASVAHFTNRGEPFEPGEVFRQPTLAGTLRRIAERGPEGFYAGETAEMIVAEMQRGGGIITMDDLASYEAKRRTPIRGTYRGLEIIGMPPPSSGGIAIVQILGMLEPHDLGALGHGSSATVHLYAEAARRAFADRARYLGDPEANPTMPVERLISPEYVRERYGTIDANRASASSPETFEWPPDRPQTTHLSVVDGDRNAVSLTYTLEASYGSAIVVPGAGFLLNNEMGDFNPAPGRTTPAGSIGTEPNLTRPGARMLSSMSPTIVRRDGAVYIVTGSPGGRTIINTVAQTILNIVDHGMDAQAAVDAGRIHHQWLPDEIRHESHAFPAEVAEALGAMGHALRGTSSQGVAQVIVVEPDGSLSAGADRRWAESAAAGH
ncbi:MAG: gamma-glutamyltransferase [Planctomycetota bacterium]